LHTAHVDEEKASYDRAVRITQEKIVSNLVVPGSWFQLPFKDLGLQAISSASSTATPNYIDPQQPSMPVVSSSHSIFQHNTTNPLYSQPLSPNRSSYSNANQHNLSVDPANQYFVPPQFGNLYNDYDGAFDVSLGQPSMPASFGNSYNDYHNAFEQHRSGSSIGSDIFVNMYENSYE